MTFAILRYSLAVPGKPEHVATKSNVHDVLALIYQLGARRPNVDVLKCLNIGERWSSGRLPDGTLVKVERES